MSIPKIIHYCWFGGNPLPEMAVKCIDSWRKFCPDYQIMEWNEKNFPIDYCDYVKEAYEAKKWAFVSDVARLRALVEYGGVYMDIDVEIVKPLDDLLEYEAVSGFESPTEITTAFMACEKGNGLFEEFLKSYEDAHFVGKDGEYDLTTNVERITGICKKYGFVENNQQQVIRNYWLFPKDYFSPKSYITKEIELTENTYVIHHFDGSWYTEEIKYRNRLIDKLIKIMSYRMASYIATFMGELKYKGIRKSMKRVLRWIKKKDIKIQKKIENIHRYGIGYQLERVLLKFGLRKDLSVRSLQKIQQFYEKLDPKDYPKYLKQWYFEQSGRELDLDHPKRLTEKIQWLKLYDSTEVKTRLADKLLVRDWVAEKIGEEYLIPLYGAWDSFDEIDFENLPDSFVLKCNHGCAMNEIVKDKNTIDKKSLKKKVDRWMKTDFAFIAGSFELHYHDIPRKIIVEKYMKDEKTEDLQDYKFFCFHGKPMYCQVIGSRTTNETIDFFDMDWNHMPFIGLVKKDSKETNSTEMLPKPQSFDVMKRSAEILSEEFAFVRVDFYEINGKMYFGEMTFTPGSGSGSFRPDEVDYELGKLLKLKSKENNIFLNLGTK